MSKKNTEEIEYVSKGKRVDGRKVDEIRPISIKAGVLPNADGSAYIEWGQNKIIVGVYGPKEALPKHIADPYKAVIRFQYGMAAFSVPERKAPRPGRREIEISKVCGEALERAVFLEKFPNTMIEIQAQVLDSNAGSRVAALTAAAVALADAGIPMRGLVSGCAIGRAGGHLIADLNKTEEDAPDAVDLAFAAISNSKEIVLMQMDGRVTEKEFKELMELGLKSAEKVHEFQKKALIEKYKNPENQGDKK